MDSRQINLRVNGKNWQGSVSTRMTLADFLRDQLGLTGTHLGCEHGVCGACTVHFDGEAGGLCLMLAVQANGHQIGTVEGLGQNGQLSKLQESFHRQHALQCGFCTPGFLMTATAFLRSNPNPSEQSIREALSGNLCGCTGYKGIVQAVREASQEDPAASPAPPPCAVGTTAPACAAVMGVSIGRREDQRLLRGKGTYTS